VSTITTADCVEVSARYAGNHRIAVGYTKRSLNWAKPKLVLLYEGKVHDLGSSPSDYATFATLSGNGRAPRSTDVRVAAKNLRQAAYDGWLLAKGTPAPTPAPTPVPETPKEPSVTVTDAPSKPNTSSMSPIEAAIVDAVAQVATSSIIDTITPEVKRLVSEAIEQRVPRPVEIRVPNSEPVVFEGVTHEVMPVCITWLNAGKHVFLTGDAGTGKTTLGRDLAKALGRRFFPMSKITDVFDLKGYTTATGSYVTTAFREAFEHGGLVNWDEYDASDENAVLWANAAIANGFAIFPDSTEPVHAHKDFGVVANGNTLLTGADDRFTGRNRQDAAAIDRFVFIEVLYSEAIENALTTDAELLSFVRAFRKACADCGIDHTVSYRAIRDMDLGASLGISLGGRNGVVHSALTKHLTADDTRIIGARMTGMSANKWHRALETAA
jgi:cobaltochelatase CobS